MKICAIVVTYNRLEQLRITLPRLLDEALDHVVVVDNASTDDTARWLATQGGDRVRVLTLDDNTGGAGGFEAGMAHARDALDPDWMVLMDDDARPLPRAIETFRRETPVLETQFPNLGCIAAAVTFPDGDVCEMNRPSRNPFWHAGLFLKTLFGDTRSSFHVPDSALAPEAAATEIDVASFVGYFVNRRAVSRVGLPEGGLFIYGDDVLYSLALRRAGLDVVLAPAVRFEHDCRSLTEGLMVRPVWKVYYLTRNGVAVARQAAGRLLFPAALAFYIVQWTRRGRHAPKGPQRDAYYTLMRRGIRDGLLGRRGRHDPAHDLARAADKASISA
ncbi:glycosyltransferase [Salipiger sp. IMCC34102]|uniref:glycosyltransferase n=1 Tax=Salipiger sp. IMCC34102 TaxID=2510647 RepID=UPI00101BB858|nr:glycosyltransferase [Salipiger sp. IMCC34102]RYH01042.1 glycosyltransferase [Salipiger sp. IMCC34102]